MEDLCLVFSMGLEFELSECYLWLGVNFKIKFCTILFVRECALI